MSWPALAEAQNQRPLAEALQVEPGASCVTAVTLTPQIEAWLGSAFVDAELTVSVRGHASDPRDVAFEVRRGGRSLGERRFRPAPWVCAQLEATLALAIAMALKVSLRDELLDALGGTPKGRGQAAVGLLLRSGFDVLPRFSLGGALTASQLFAGRFALRAELFADAARGASFASVPGSFDTLLLSAQLGGCALWPLGPAWGTRVCLGFALGALQARGQDYARSRSDWLAWLAASNSVALSLRVTEHWWLDVPASVVVPLNKVTFGVEREEGGVAAASALPRLGVSLAAGPEYHF